MDPDFFVEGRTWTFLARYFLLNFGHLPFLTRDRPPAQEVVVPRFPFPQPLASLRARGRRVSPLLLAYDPLPPPQTGNLLQVGPKRGSSSPPGVTRQANPSPKLWIPNRSFLGWNVGADFGR